MGFRAHGGRQAGAAGLHANHPPDYNLRGGLYVESSRYNNNKYEQKQLNDLNNSQLVATLSNEVLGRPIAGFAGDLMV